MRNRFLSAAVVAGIVAGLTSGAVITMGPASVPVIGDVYAAHVAKVDCYGFPLTLWQAYGPANPDRTECEAIDREMKLAEQKRIVDRLLAAQAALDAAKAGQ
jgi:hypothetical protein